MKGTPKKPAARAKPKKPVVSKPPRKPAAIFKLATHWELGPREANSLRELLRKRNRDRLKAFMKRKMRKVVNGLQQHTRWDDRDIQKSVQWVLAAFDDPGHRGHWPRINFLIEQDHLLN